MTSDCNGCNWNLKHKCSMKNPYIYKFCPCGICIVKTMCNIMCDEWEEYYKQKGYTDGSDKYNSHST